MCRSTSGATEVQIVPPTCARSSTGDSTACSMRLTSPQSTIVQARGTGSPLAMSWPTRKRAISSSGRWVADNPMRCGGSSHCWSRRSSVSARCAPRLLPAIAWISSMMTALTPLNMPRPRTVVSMMCNDSGVVIRMCGDLRSIRARADCGVSPVRTATRISGNDSPAASNRSRSSASGRSRLRWMSLLSALSGET